MGLSVAISGGIVLTVIMLILLSIPGLVDKMFSIGDVTSQVAHFDKTISDTKISMNHVSTLLNEPTLNFTLKNDGSEKLWNFNDFDLFVTYEGAVSEQLTEEITYSGDCLGGLPAQGNWCIESITGDLLDPGILNSAEGANIRVLLNEDLADVNAIVSITTDNGVTNTVLAPYCGPSCYQIVWDVASDEGTTGFNNIHVGNPSEYDDNNDRHRTMLDLTDMTEWRLVIQVDDDDGSPACVMGAQYSTDAGVTWFGLDNGIVGVMSTVTNSCNDGVPLLVSAWTLLDETAMSDVLLRIVGDDDDDNDPQFGTVELQFRS